MRRERRSCQTKKNFPQRRKSRRGFGQDLQDEQDWAFGSGFAGNHMISGRFDGAVMVETAPHWFRCRNYSSRLSSSKTAIFQPFVPLQSVSVMGSVRTRVV